MPRQKPQTETKHPPEYERDLNPQHMAGQNIGEQSAGVSPDFRLASEIKDIVRCLQDFTADELREIPVVCAGVRLQQNATYVDLRDPDRRPFTATGNMTASPESWYVPKSEVPYMYWNRLVHVDDPDRQQ